MTMNQYGLLPYFPQDLFVPGKVKCLAKLRSLDPEEISQGINKYFYVSHLLESKHREMEYLYRAAERVSPISPQTRHTRLPRTHFL